MGLLLMVSWGIIFIKCSYQMHLVNILKCLVQGTCQPGPKGEKGDQGTPGTPAERRESDFRFNILKKRNPTDWEFCLYFLMFQVIVRTILDFFFFFLKQ